MEVFQPTGNIHQLKKRCQWVFARSPGRNSYQLQSLYFRACNDEVHDGAMSRPLGNHHHGSWRPFSPHQRQQVLVFELFPLNHFATESLLALVSASHDFVGTKGRTLSRLMRSALGVNPQNLDRDLGTLIHTAPHIRVTTSPTRVFFNCDS